MAYNPSILPEILRARSLSKAELGRRLDIDVPELDRQLSRDPEPTQTILNHIASELALPTFVFFMSSPPFLADILPDFRSKDGRPTSKSTATIEAIQFARAIQQAACDALPKSGISLPS